MKKALITLAIGDRYLATFKKYCRESWHKYANQHNLDVVVIDSPIDDSPRAQSRSPAWQKCLVLSHPNVKSYDQVAWVDSDILINPTSPNVFKDVPLEMIGAVDLYATPNVEDYRFWLEQLSEESYDELSRIGSKEITSLIFEAQLTAEEADPEDPKSGNSLADIERSHIKRILEKTNQNKTQAAKILGIPRSTLIGKMKKLGIYSNMF